MLQHAVETVRNTKDDNVRLKGAFGLIDRAGYGEVEQKSVTHNFQISNEAMHRVSEAFERFAPDATEDVSDYASFVVKGSEAEGPPNAPSSPGATGVGTPPTDGSLTETPEVQEQKRKLA
jgi:hypothetical protein